MSLAYVPGRSIAHRLDPRTKLLMQAGVAAAAFAYTTPRGLTILTILAVGCVWAADGTVREVAWTYRWAGPFLLVAPLVAGATLGDPWFQVDRATTTGLASYRVVLVLLVAGAYVRSTPVRESRAAIQWLVPGKPGQFLGIGVSLVFRFLPLLRRDLAAARDGVRARGGDRLPIYRRMTLIATAGIRRAFGRADRLALALNARCLAWNPTLPALRFGRADVVVLAIGFGLLVAASLPVLSVGRSLF